MGGLVFSLQMGRLLVGVVEKNGRSRGKFISPPRISDNKLTTEKTHIFSAFRGGCTCCK